MPSLTHSQNFPIQKQLLFEQDLLAGKIQNERILDPLFLVAEYKLSEEQAQLVLNCAYRKGLLDKAESGGYKRKKPEEPQITSVFQHAEKTGMKPKSLVRAVSLEPSPADIAEKLALSEGEPIFRQKRSRLINDLVVANQCNSIPYCVVPDLKSLELQNKSFQVVLETKYHAVVHSIQEDFSLIEPTKEDQRILKLDGIDHILAVHRLSLSATKQPLVWADIHVNPKHFHLVEKLWPQAADLIDSKG